MRRGISLRGSVLTMVVVATLFGTLGAATAVAESKAPGAAWPQVGFDGGGSSFNPSESTIDAANVDRLVPQWKTAALATASVRQFVVGGGRLFVASPNGLSVYSLARCPTLAHSCRPQWTGSGAFSDVAYARGVVYAGGGNTLAAFDADGGSACVGVPKTCPPRWRWTDTPPTGVAIVDRIKIANGRVWVADLVFVNESEASSHVRAFDLTGSSCTAQRCSPVLSIATPRNDFDYALGPQIVAVANSADPSGSLRVYDARTGAEQWRSTRGASFSVIVRGSQLFFADRSTLRVEAYPVAGGSACSGTPRVCQPSFVMPFSWNNPPTIAATPNTVYVNEGNDIRAFDATGAQNCFGAPRVCQPLWSYSIASGTFPLPQPTVANGVLYSFGPSGIGAFDATGVVGCGGETHTCSPMWTTTPTAGGPIEVAGGVAYIQTDDIVTAYHLAG